MRISRRDGLETVAVKSLEAHRIPREDHVGILTTRPYSSRLRCSARQRCENEFPVWKHRSQAPLPTRTLAEGRVDVKQPRFLLPTKTLKIWSRLESQVGSHLGHQGHRFKAPSVSKVLHRRRPQIVPLYDSRVQDFYGVRKPENFRAALWEDIQGNLDWLSEMASTKKTPDGREFSVLRLADILIWTP